MERWIVSGHAVDAILALTAFEWVAVTAYHRLTRRGLDGARIGLTLLPGVFLLLALRAALAGAGWTWTAACLTAALFAHIADLARRWNG